MPAKETVTIIYAVITGMGLFWYLVMYITASLTWDIKPRHVRERMEELVEKGCRGYELLSVARNQLWNQHFWSVCWNTWVFRVPTIVFFGSFLVGGIIAVIALTLDIFGYLDLIRWVG